MLPGSLGPIASDGRDPNRVARVPAHLRPSTPIAPDAILVGDPGRALLLAQELLRGPKMSNHARGLWGYSGETAEGAELTVQSTGIGAPSAALVLRDLADLGLRRAVRVGTCGAGDPGLALGTILVVEEAVAADPLGGLVDAGETVRPASELFEGLGDVGPATAVRSGELAPALFGVASTAAVRDLQTAALLALAARLEVAAAALLIVAANAGGDRIGDQELEEAAKRAGRAAAAALSG
jgi:uridine phosphorylase